MRRKLVAHGTMGFDGSPIKFKKKEWVEEECGTPIFGNNSHLRKVCNSCLDGWTHKENFMLDTDKNKRLLKNEVR